MARKIEITVDVIVHATEDDTKIFQSFEDVLDITEKDFVIRQTQGHYGNPIVVLTANIVKKQAQNLIAKISELLSAQQITRLVEEIEERTVDSRFHMRLDKQELIKGNLDARERGAIKLKIHTPIYNKKDTVKTFTEIFQITN